MSRQIRHMTRLVEDLLDVSRVTQRKISLRKEPVELTTIVKQAAELYRGEAEARAQNLVLTLPPQRIYVDGDSTRLEQIFSNLLSNATKFSSSGSRIDLTMEIEPAIEEHENVRTGDGDPPGLSPAHAVVRVRDQGIGLSEEVLPRVFDLFMQSSRSLDRSQGGLGIGLTLVKELIDLHGGTVEAHSAGPGKGSEFVVRLPMLSGKATKALEATSPKEASADQPVSRRVLVVDDNEDEASGLAMVMKLAGHQVEVANEGETALAAAHTFRPEVVLLDIGLPGMNGYEVASHLRRQSDTAKMLLVALTGYGQEHDRQRALEAGFDFHFTKPVEPVVLKELISNHPSQPI
jgi:CheY-like chemotaxis protein